MQDPTENRSTHPSPQGNLPRTAKSRFTRGLFLVSSFFLSGMLFLNQGFLSVFSPFPLLYFAARARWNWTLAAILSNALTIVAVTLALPGSERLAFFSVAYLVIVGGMVVGLKRTLLSSLDVDTPMNERFWTFSSFVRVKRPAAPQPAEKEFLIPNEERLSRLQSVLIAAAAIPMTGMLLFGAAFMLLAEKPTALLRSEIEQVLGARLADLPKGPEVPTLADLVETVVEIFPAVLLFLPLLYLAINFILWIRSVPPPVHQQIGVFPEDLLSWKLPEAAVWGLILCGAGTWAASAASEPLWVVAGGSLVRLFVFLYGLQGLSVVAYGLTRVKFGGFLRALVLVFGGLVVVRATLIPFQLGSISTLVMTGWIPLLGLFDLWIDFRGKMRHPK